ncbi:MAG: 2-dehydropantoate 2-reductase [Chloroflexota bacterium]
MRIAVVGIGALGSLLGARLSVVADVILFGHWPEQIAAVRRNGLRIEDLEGNPVTYEVSITSDPELIAGTNIVLVAVKSRQTSKTAQILSERLNSTDLVITLQNGLNNRERLVEILGPERVVIGVTSEGATLLAPGIVRHAGRGHTFLSLHDALRPEPKNRLMELAGVFTEAGFDTQIVVDVSGLVWSKLAVNAAINPLTALLQVPNGFLLEHQPLKDIMRQAVEEVATVAQSQGIELPYPIATEQAYRVAEATAANISSMLQDFRRGVPTEIGDISGAISYLGQEKGISTPVNSRLYQLVRDVETGTVPPLKPGDVDGLLYLMAINMGYN